MAIACYDFGMAMIRGDLKNLGETLLVFRSNLILVNKENDDLPGGETVEKLISHHLVRDWFSEPSLDYTALLLEDDAPTPSGFRFISLRHIFAKQDSPKNSKIARAHALLLWRERTQYCSHCGLPLKPDKFETALHCALCLETFYPSISPAVIILVEKNDTILLARHKNRNTDVFTCLAGYIEQGESAEEAVAREIKEEVGIAVSNIRYITSQSWPFPDQLMMAFKAEYKSGDIQIQESEIQEVAWFSRDKLPSIPKPGSVAHKLIMGLI